MKRSKVSYLLADHWSYSFHALCLLSGDDIPQRGTCQCPLTVEHIPVECVGFNDV